MRTFHALLYREPGITAQSVWDLCPSSVCESGNTLLAQCMKVALPQQSELYELCIAGVGESLVPHHLQPVQQISIYSAVCFYSPDFCSILWRIIRYSALVLFGVSPFPP